MPDKYRIDGQYRILNNDVTDSVISKKLADLDQQNSAPDKARGLYNIKKTAAMIDGDAFSLSNAEAQKVVEALEGWQASLLKSYKPITRALQTAFVSGMRVNRVFNQVSANKKYNDYPVAIGSRFYNQRNVKVYYKIQAEDDGVTYPIIEDVTDDYGFSQINFSPEKSGNYKIFASTDKKDLEGNINLSSPKLAIGKLEMLSDAPTIAIDIAGLLHQYGLEKSREITSKLHAAGYNLIGITPFNDLHAQDRLSALVEDAGMPFVKIVHNSFWISDYYETDRGRQEFLGEYVKYLSSIRGIPIVAGIGFSDVTKKGFEIAGLESENIFVPEKATKYGKKYSGPDEAWQNNLLQHFLSEDNLTNYKLKVGQMVASRDSSDYRERMSYIISKATATKYTDGNYFTYVRDNSPKADHNHAAFFTYCDFIKRASPASPLLMETYAWHSDEEGLTIALYLADKAFQSKRIWDLKILQRLDQIRLLAENEGEKILASRIASIKDKLANLSTAELNPGWRRLADNYVKILKAVDSLPNEPMVNERKRLWRKREALYYDLKNRLEQLKLYGAKRDLKKEAMADLEAVLKDVSTPAVKSALQNLLKVSADTPRSQVYILADKTAVLEFPAPAGYHNGLLALEIMEKSGVYVTVPPLTFGFADAKGIVDPQYLKHAPVDQLIPAKHSKYAVMKIRMDDGSYEWVALGGGRFPGTKMMGSRNYQRDGIPSNILRFLGQGVRNFEDDTYLLKGPVVAEIFDKVMNGIKKIRPYAAIKDGNEIIFSNDRPPKAVVAGENRMWPVQRWPWEGVSPADMIWHMISNNSVDGKEMTIINGFNLDRRWEAQLKHFLFAGSAGAAEKINKKIKFYTGGIGLVGDMVDKPKTEKLVQLALWLREARKEAVKRGDSSYEDKIDLYIIKARQYDPATGKRLDPIEADNQQIHNRIYLLEGANKSNSFAMVGNQNVDVMSIKDQENADVIWGPGVDQVRERIAELHSMAIHLNEIPGVVVPKADGKYLDKGELYDLVWNHITKMSPGHNMTSPTSLKFFDAFKSIAGTFLSNWWERFLDQPDSYGANIHYMPTLIGNGGFSLYNRLDVDFDLAKNYGLRNFVQLLIGAAVIGNDYAGLNFGVGFDSLIAEPKKERESFTARYVSLDMKLSLLFSTDGKDVAGSFNLGTTPVTLAFHPGGGKTEIALKPIELGLMTHFGSLKENLAWPETGLFLGAQFDVRWRNLPDVRDGDAYKAIHPEDE